MRGNRGAAGSAAPENGSIPACAGEPSTSSYSSKGLGVYPRVCGGTRQEPHGVISGEGLSPRVRGNRGGIRLRFRRGRSIPACAGEPFVYETMYAMRRVYPRVCGGTRGSSCEIGCPYGLSPRVRGNQPVKTGRGNPAGSIPACAGEPAFLCALCWSSRVYPRVCGGTPDMTPWGS